MAHSDRLYIRCIDFDRCRMLDEMDGEHESVPACFSEENAAHSLEWSPDDFNRRSLLHIGMGIIDQLASYEEADSVNFLIRDRFRPVTVPDDIGDPR